MPQTLYFYAITHVNYTSRAICSTQTIFLLARTVSRSYHGSNQRSCFKMPKNWSKKSDHVSKRVICASPEATEECGFDFKMFLSKLRRGLYLSFSPHKLKGLSETKLQIN